ncbi:hypothetical protein M8J77_005212 [Diaphorina citri]|nr:hypothetical protein M8J77_005212 [Diaphorina citri]
MYEQAEVKIVSGRSQEATPACSITKGVLQGDSISPLLFIIFLNDIEEYFRSKGTRGVSINHVQDILLLLYADDLVVFASDKMDLQRKLNILQEYCQVNKMTVNVTKSKVVIFRRGGRVAASDKFQYNGEEMEVVSEYNYLGIMFSSHGVFHKASQQALSKGRVAMACVKVDFHQRDFCRATGSRGKNHIVETCRATRKKVVRPCDFYPMKVGPDQRNVA